MKCPVCTHVDSKVLESRSIEENTVMKRRRSCAGCGFRFTTYERIEVVPLIVIKKGGKRELFNHEKILRGLSTACQKRPISFEQLETLTKGAESHILNQGIYEVTSSEIGEYVLKRLRALDEIAYIRFASVYRQFKDVDSFIQEISQLQNEK